MTLTGGVYKNEDDIDRGAFTKIRMTAGGRFFGKHRITVFCKWLSSYVCKRLSPGCHPEASEGPCIQLGIQGGITGQTTFDLLNLKYKVLRRPQDDIDRGRLQKLG